METLMLILGSSFASGARAGELGFKKLLESSEFWRNRLNGIKFACKSVRGLKAVAGDAEDRRLIRKDTPLRIEFACRCHCTAARGFGEDAFAFRQQRHGFHNLSIARVLRPSTAAENCLGGV